ncbi:MAG: hypothetical protein ABH842_02230 [Candidatus Micrarchaeota archaeon]
MKISKSKIGPRHNIRLPSEFLEHLGLKVNDPVFILLDEKNHTLRVSQFKSTNIYEILITMKDKPGSLAWLASVLYEHHFDIVFTEAHSMVRNKSAWWRAVGTFKSKQDITGLKRDLQKNGATSVTIVHL